MNFDKEYEEITEIIQEIRDTVTAPLEKKDKAATPPTIEELEAILHRTQEIIDKLNKKANAICEKLGKSREELESYVQNPANFRAEEWKAIEDMQNQVEQFRKALMKTLLDQKNKEQVKKK